MTGIYVLKKTEGQEFGPFYFAQLPITVGRRGAHVQIPDNSVSRKHAVLEANDKKNDKTGIIAVDHSRTGTSVNRCGCGDGVPFRVGDVIQFGPKSQRYTLDRVVLDVGACAMSRSTASRFSELASILGISPSPSQAPYLMVCDSLRPDPVLLHALVHGSIPVTTAYLEQLAGLRGESAVPNPADDAFRPSVDQTVLAMAADLGVPADVDPDPARATMFHRYTFATDDTELEALVLAAGGATVNPTSTADLDPATALVIVADGLDAVPGRLVMAARAVYNARTDDTGPIGRAFVIHHNAVLIALMTGRLALPPPVEWPDESDTDREAPAVTPKVYSGTQALPVLDSDDSMEGTEVDMAPETEVVPEKVPEDVVVESAQPPPEPQPKSQPVPVSKERMGGHTVKASDWIALPRPNKTSDANPVYTNR